MDLGTIIVSLIQGLGMYTTFILLAEINLYHVFVKSVFGFQVSPETMKEEEGI